MSQAPPVSFGLSAYTTTPVPFDDDLAICAAAGIYELEICQFKLDPARAGDQLKQVLDAGLTIPSVQPQVHSIYPDTMAHEPADPAQRMAKFRDLIDIVGPIVPNTVLVSITGPAPAGNFRLATQTAIREYRQLAIYAADHGIRIALEPLNPILMNVDSFIGGIAEALDIIDSVAHPSFGIWLDLWHYWQDPEWRANVARCKGRIFGVHVSDWRTPSAFGDRLTIGDGVIPIPAMLRAIHDTGYRGTYTAELFSDRSLPDSLWNGDFTQLAVNNKKGFEKAWQAAFAS